MTPRSASGSPGPLPRSTVYLAVILLVAVTVLFFLRRQPVQRDYTLGGRLFEATADQVEGLLLTRQGVQYRLDRTADGVWTLSGAISDFLDQAAAATMVDKLTSASGGRLLPGSLPEDRRYDFNGPGALRFTLFTTDGGSEPLAVGAQNPVTELYYGSGAGRQSCFPVSAGLRELLAALPASLQLKTLLPEVGREAVTEMEIWRGDQRDLLQRWNNRWWLKMPEAGTAVLGPWYRDYATLYGDRQAERDDGLWLLANDQEARLVIFECSQSIVKEIKAPGDAARLRGDLDLDPPWRKVVLHGPDINPDPTAGPADKLEIAFAQASSQNLVPVLRRGNLLLTESTAVATVSQPLADLLDARALDFVIALADSLVLEREGRLLLMSHRDKNPAQPGERFKERPVDFWRTDFPVKGPTDQAERSYHGHTQNLLTNLDRTKMLRVLPPTSDATVLKDNEKVRLKLWFSEGPKALGAPKGEVVLVIGFLDTDRLPAGSPDLASSEDGLPPVGLWRPDTGQLLQIPGFTITTVRAWAQD